MTRPWRPVMAGLLCLACAFARGGDEPCLRYDARNTDKYFGEKIEARSPRSRESRALAALMKREVLELAEKDWGPWLLYSHPVNQQGNRFTYLNCPDELLVALALAVPHLDAEGRAAAKRAADREFRRHPPFSVPIRGANSDVRGWYGVADGMKKSMGPGTWLDGKSRTIVAFRSLYGLWAYADAFGRWDLVEKAWPHVRKLKDNFARGCRLEPEWKKKGGPGVLTAGLAEDKEYLHYLLRFFLVGTHGFYGNSPPRDQHINVFKQYSYPKILSALIGYGRMARKVGDGAEEKWAKDAFNIVARQALTYRTSPAYWSSPWLTPEVGRMLRDSAGGFIDKVKATPNVFKGTYERNGREVGPRYLVWDPHHWYVQHLGSHGSVPPCSAMSGFLVQAYLFKTRPEKLDDWTDVPLCQADYWYVQKCAVAINAYERAGWTKID